MEDSVAPGTAQYLHYGDVDFPGSESVRLTVGSRKDAKSAKECNFLADFAALRETD
jgi:hypothetical protein